MLRTIALGAALCISLTLAAAGVALAQCGGAIDHSPSVVENENQTPVALGAYVGLTLVEAEDLAASEGRRFRVVEIDGEPQMTTKDFVIGRLNAELENGVVVSISEEGAPVS